MDATPRREGGRSGGGHRPVKRRARLPRRRAVRLADGRRLEALCWDGVGLPLVLLHGLLDCAEGWTAVAGATERPCVAIDLPGFGGSEPPTHPAFSAYAADVLEAVNELLGARSRFVLVGHSLGGGVATALAERIPRRVLALVLLAPAGFGRIPLAEAVSLPGVRLAAERALPLALGNRRAVSVAYRMFVTNGAAPDDALLARLLIQRQSASVGAREATKAVVRSGLSAHAFHRRGVRYDGPVTLLWGDRDRVVPPGHQAAVVAAFARVDAHVWRGMGHHPQHERLEDLMPLIESVCVAAERRLSGGASGRGRAAAA